MAGSGGVGPDTLGVALLEDPRYSLPTKKLPDGKYLVTFTDFGNQDVCTSEMVTFRIYF